MAETRGPGPAASLHVVVFPWLAMGHMIPFMELSRRLAARGHAVTFVSTPRNAARLALPPGVRVAALDLPKVDGLPEGPESTADVPPEKVGLLKKAFDGLAAPFAALVAGFERRPDWIVHDFAHNWIWPIAEERQVPCAMLLIFPAGLTAFIGPRHENLAHSRTATEDYMVPPPWIPFPSTLAYRRHEAEQFAPIFRPNESGVSDTDRFWEMLERPSCRIVVYRSCPELEPRLFPLLTELFSKPAVPAGLLLPDVDAGDEAADQSFAPAMRWLDAQPRRSVIYVALGSEAPVTAEQLGELALGLELSGARFLWALRRPSSLAAGEPLLPEGFEQRGVVRVGWVPQVRARRGGRVPDPLRLGLHRGEPPVRAPAGDAAVRRRPGARRADHGREGRRRGGGQRRRRRWVVRQARRRGGGAPGNGGRGGEGAGAERRGAARRRRRHGPAGAVPRRAHRALCE